MKASVKRLIWLFWLSMPASTRGPESSPFTAHSPFSVYAVPGNRRPAGHSRMLVKRWLQTAQRLNTIHPHPLSQNPSWEWPGSRMRKGEAGVHSWPGWKCRSLLTLYFALQRVVLSWDECQSHKIKRGKCEIKGSHFRVAGCFLGGKEKKKKSCRAVVASCWANIQNCHLFLFSTDGLALSSCKFCQELFSLPNSKEIRNMHW